MPVLMWEERVDGKRFARVKTSWRTGFDGEEHRELAEMLDAAIDEVLDRAVELRERNASLEAQREFIRTWSLGRAVAESGILDHEAMRNEQRINLWQAMEQKALLGVRADGDSESRWPSVRSNVKHAISRPERHLFEIGLWLQEQEFGDARIVFMGRASNPERAFLRQAMRSLKIRKSLQRWLMLQDDQALEWLLKTSNYVALCKAIAKRWPDRGPGSAKRPEHYRDERLDMELSRVLDPVVRHRNRTGD